MRLLKKTALVALPVLSLAGCAGFNIPFPTLPQQQAPLEMVSASLPQICREADKNPVRATDLYAKKGLSTTGKVQVVSEGFNPRYRVLLRSGNVSIHAGTDNQLAIKSVSTGKTTRVSGVITDVSYDHTGCSISLGDAKF
ncbi:hypothetical protein F7T25_15960 [Salmonella enterica]|nr:hypothetical protein [Salmonella enterica]